MQWWKAYRVRVTAAGFALLLSSVAGLMATAVALATIAGAILMASVVTSLRGGNGIPLTPSEITIALFDLYSDVRLLLSAFRKRMELLIIMNGDPFHWKDTLFKMRGRAVYINDKRVCFFRVISVDDPIDTSAARKRNIAQPIAAWFYRTNSEPNNRDWMECAELYRKFLGPSSVRINPPQHALDLYDRDGISLGMSVVVKLWLCDWKDQRVIQQIFELRCKDRTVLSFTDTAYIGGLSAEEMITKVVNKKISVERFKADTELSTAATEAGTDAICKY